MCAGVRVPGVVVGAGTQDVTQWVPGQTPDHPLVSHLHPPDLLLHPDNTNGDKVKHECGNRFAEGRDAITPV